MKKLPALDYFQLVYVSLYSEHGQVHDQILDMISKALRESRKFDEVSVITSCPKNFYGGCKQRTNALDAEFRKKKRIKYFSIKTVRFIWTPFYKDGLVF